MVFRDIPFCFLFPDAKRIFHVIQTVLPEPFCSNKTCKGCICFPLRAIYKRKQVCFGFTSVLYYFLVTSNGSKVQNQKTFWKGVFLFGIFNNNEADFGVSSNYGWGINTPNHESYEARRQRNERMTRDYFREIYGADPMDLGFEVPDWEWN